MKYNSYYHDLKNDTIISEEEYHKRMEQSLEGGLNYFGQYRNRAEAQMALDSDYSFLKFDKYWNPQAKPKLNDELFSKSIPEKKSFIRKGLYLDIFINDEDESIRAEVAKTGYQSEILANDSSKRVRIELAKNGYALDKLVYDSAWEVRSLVAMKGYGLDILINDPEEYVKEAALRAKEKFKYQSLDSRIAKAKVNNESLKGNDIEKQPYVKMR